MPYRPVECDLSVLLEVGGRALIWSSFVTPKSSSGREYRPVQSITTDMVSDICQSWTNGLFQIHHCGLLTLFSARIKMKFLISCYLVDGQPEKYETANYVTNFECNLNCNLQSFLFWKKYKLYFLWITSNQAFYAHKLLVIVWN